MVDLILGTAQLGLDYGVTNLNGRPNDSETTKLLEMAVNSGICTLDTASAYGDAEVRLGNLGFSSKFKVVSKFQCMDENILNVEEHLNRLQLDSIYGLLFHSALQLNSAEGISSLSKLRAARSSGFVEKIGFSAYTVEEVYDAISIFPDVDLIQVPGNALDFKILDSEITEHLQNLGVEIHVRSIFLQGVLLQKGNDSLGNKFFDFIDPLKKIENKAYEAKQSIIQFLINQIRCHPNVSAIVVGASTTQELSEIVDAWNSPCVASSRIEHTLNQNNLDPRNWQGSYLK
jgi:aryl-alcohol dehydrogenase-like predicted oxidoreductase